MSTSMRSIRLLLATGAAIALSALMGLPAGAQEDPYGSTTTTTAPTGEATIELTSEVGPAGGEVGVFACGYLPSEDDDAPRGSITFDGEVLVGGLVVNAEGCLTTGGQGGGRSAATAGQASRTAPLTIVIPEDSRPGQHRVCAVMAGWNTPCAKYRVENPRVKGVSTERPGQAGGGDAQVAGTSTDRLLGLPVTGAAIGVLVLTAIVLVAVGRILLKAQRLARR
ncbi:MAG: hypothetical protein ACLGI8_15780 [Acidimicrobiia bacterium]|jgi:hypothetical protein